MFPQHRQPLEGRAGFPGSNSKKKSLGKEGVGREEDKEDIEPRGSPSASHCPFSRPLIILSVHSPSHSWGGGLSSWASPGSHK